MKSSEALGIIGGLGPAAGIYYYAKLMDVFRECGRELRLSLVHADLPTVLRYVRNGEVAFLTEYLRCMIESLARSGASLAAIPAVTPHICISELTAVVSIPLVNMLEAVALELSQRDLRRVALFGTRQVIESDLFGALHEVDVVRPESKEIEFIDETYRALATRGSGTSGEREALAQLAIEICRRERLDAILLAGTDLSALFDETEPSFPTVDCARVHIAAILRRALKP